MKRCAKGEEGEEQEGEQGEEDERGGGRCKEIIWEEVGGKILDRVVLLERKAPIDMRRRYHWNRGVNRQEIGGEAKK